MRARTLLGLLLPVLAIAASVFCLWRAQPPYLWIAGIAVALAAYGFFRSRGIWRVLAFNAGAVVLILGIAEAWCWRTTPAGRLRTEVSPNFVNSHEYLGNAPYPGMVTTVSRFDRDSLLFRVNYTIDSLGWRATPPAGDAAAEPARVAFFGCSLTFGEGVPDSATLPAQLERASHGRYRGVNFGFSGWGPHQMLAILEHRLEASSLARPPVLGVYLAIPDHVYRALGRTSWDPGPRYRASEEGGVRFAGRFHSPLGARLRDLAHRSYLLRRVTGAWQQRLSDADYDLFLEIVAASRREFLDRYPGSDFVVIYWDSREDTPRSRAHDQRLTAGFAARGIRCVKASELLPGYPAQARRYLLSADDPHPNALAYRTLAAAVSDRLIALPPASASPPGR